MRLGKAGRITSALALAVLCLAACTQTSSAPRVGGHFLKINAPDAMVWCLLHRRIIPLRDVRGQPWFKNGRMQDNSDLVLWKFKHSKKTYGGKTLGRWISQAQHQWPAWLCGPEPTAFPTAPVSSGSSPSP